MKRSNIILVVCLVLVVGAFGYWLFSKNSGANQAMKENYSQVAVSLSEIKYPENRVAVTHEVYTVKEGDTLESIAKEYDLEVNSIVWTSELTEEEIEVGQELKIPPKDGLFVTIVEGDTLEKVAEEYGVEAQVIADYNWLDYPFELEVDSKIFVPGGTK